MELPSGHLQYLEQIVARAFADSARSLSQMTTGEINLHEPELSFLPLKELPGIAGGPASVVVAVYLAVEGDIHGHVVLLFQPENARGLVDLLLGHPTGTCKELDELAASALAELGNVCSSAFMNAIADRTGLEVKPTPPVVVEDMAGAILQAVVVDLYQSGEEAQVVATSFNGALPGHLLLMPDTVSMARLVAALEAIR